MGRLFLVSNRLPVSAKVDAAGQVTLARSSGGLIAGLGPLHDRGQGEWIGSLGSAIIAPEVGQQLEKQRLFAVTADPEDTRRHYEGYSNTVLWPLCHYLIEQVTFDPDDFEAYRRVNERFADGYMAHYMGRLAGDPVANRTVTDAIAGIPE